MQTIWTQIRPPDLGPNCLKRLSAVVYIRERELFTLNIQLESERTEHVVTFDFRQLAQIVVFAEGLTESQICSTQFLSGVESIFQTNNFKYMHK